MAPTGSTVATLVRFLVRWTITGTAFLTPPLAVACGLAGRNSACDGLVYKEFGLTRAEYLPCAGEMMATLDRLAAQIEMMLSGDERARSEARSTLRDLRGLLKKAGWRNMLERWNDGALTNLNVDIWNAYTSHEACLMVSSQLFGRAPLGDEKYRDGARSQCGAYRRSYRDASGEYRSLR